MDPAGRPMGWGWHPQTRCPRLSAGEPGAALLPSCEEAVERTGTPQPSPPGVPGPPSCRCGLWLLAGAASWGTRGTAEPEGAAGPAPVRPEDGVLPADAAGPGCVGRRGHARPHAGGANPHPTGLVPMSSPSHPTRQCPGPALSLPTEHTGSLAAPDPCKLPGPLEKAVGYGMAVGSPVC